MPEMRIQPLSESTIILFGEILWDEFPLPAPQHLGGAPLNVAWHLHGLGVRALPMSSVGEDEPGREALRLMEEAGLSTELVQTTVEHLRTGFAQLSLDAEGDAAFAVPHPVAYDDILPGPEVAAELAQADILYFGTLAMRGKTSRHTLGWLWDMAPPEMLRFCDLNLRAPYYDRQVLSAALSHADIVKLNGDELLELGALDLLPGIGDPHRDLSQTLPRLGQAHGLRTIYLTRGPESLVVWDATECPLPVEFPVVPVDALHLGAGADTVGAGDAFCAGVICGALRGLPWKARAQLGLDLAAHICRIRGATPRDASFYAARGLGG